MVVEVHRMWKYSLPEKQYNFTASSCQLLSTKMPQTVNHSNLHRRHCSKS